MPASRQLAQSYETALARYRSQDWDGAEAAFRECLEVVPADRPSQVMLDRIAAFRQTPLGADWDGVWVALSK